MNKLIEFLKGWLYIRVYGVNYERFINITNNNNIKMNKIRYTDEGLYMKISIKDFKKLKNIAKKSKVQIRIEEKYGFPFFLFDNRKRKMFILGISTALVIVYLLSLRVWMVSFEGNYSYTEDELKDFMMSKGIKNGVLKSKCDAEDIEKALRNEYNDIKWVSVEIIGTKMIVHIKENFNEITPENDEGNYSIVSNKDCTIISIVTRSGTPNVKAGDTVMKGDLLIGGFYDVKSDFDEPLSTVYTKADGTILARTVYEINEKLDRNYDKKVYTEEISKKYSINILNKQLNVDWFQKEYEKSDIVNSSKQLVLGESFYLPITLSKSIESEYYIERSYYSEDECYMIAKEKIDIFFQNLRQKGIQITQNNVTIEVDENNIIIKGQVICNEYIGEKRIEKNE